MQKQRTFRAQMESMRRKMLERIAEPSAICPKSSRGFQEPPDREASPGLR